MSEEVPGEGACPFNPLSDGPETEQAIARASATELIRWYQATDPTLLKPRFALRVAEFSRHFPASLLEAVLLPHPDCHSTLAANPQLRGPTLLGLLEAQLPLISVPRSITQFYGIVWVALRRQVLPPGGQTRDILHKALERARKVPSRADWPAEFRELRRALEEEPASAAELSHRILAHLQAQEEREEGHPEERDWYGQQVVEHPRTPVEEALRLVGAYDNAGVRLAIARRVTEREGEQWIQDARIRRLIVDSLPHPDAARALFRFPAEADFASALGVMYDQFPEETRAWMVEENLLEQTFSWIPLSLQAELLRDGDAEFRLHILRHLEVPQKGRGGLAHQTEPGRRAEPRGRFR